MTDDDETASSGAAPPPLRTASEAPVSDASASAALATPVLAAPVLAAPALVAAPPPVLGASGGTPTPAFDAAAERQAARLYRIALVAGPLAAVLGAVASAQGAGRLPDAFQDSPAKTFVVLVNLFFCLPYLAAFAFAFTARDAAHRPHRHALLHALLTFGMLALWTMVLVFARPR